MKNLNINQKLESQPPFSCKDKTSPTTPYTHFQSCPALKIGIMGGTFDPVHCGHLVTASEVCYNFQLDKVIFIPTGTPPHKPQNIDKWHRFFMTQQAIAQNPQFEISRCEMDTEGFSYTVDTLQKLQCLWDDRTQFFFIIGADILDEIEKWKNWQKLLTMCAFIMVMRPGYDRRQAVHKVESFKSTLGSKIYFTTVPGLDVSSTDIRERVATQRPIKYLVPQCVEQYIYDNNLYQR